MMLYIKTLDPAEMIPKKKLMALLEKEAQAFITAIVNMGLPTPIDRLNIPVISTEDKRLVEQMNQSALQRFVSDRCLNVPGAMIKFSDFYDKFVESLDPNEVNHWTKNRVGREFPPQYPKARNRKDTQFYIGNIAWASTEPNEELKFKWIIKDGYLVQMELV
jgi:hypothetical protein